MTEGMTLTLDEEDAAGAVTETIMTETTRSDREPSDVCSTSQRTSLGMLDGKQKRSDLNDDKKSPVMLLTKERLKGKITRLPSDILLQWPQELTLLQLL